MFSFYLPAWSSSTHRITPYHLLYYIFENFVWEIATRICRRNLPQEFDVAICRENLLLPFVFLIYKEILFCICEQILFIWKQTVFVGQTFLFVKFSLSIVFLFVIFVAVTSHHTEETKNNCNWIDWVWIPTKSNIIVSLNLNFLKTFNNFYFVYSAKIINWSVL